MLNKEIFKMDRQVGPKILPSLSHDSGEVRWEGKQEIFWNAPCLTTFLVFTFQRRFLKRGIIITIIIIIIIIIIHVI